MPTVLQTLLRAVTRLTQVTQSLGVSENYSALYLLVTAVLDGVKEALQDQQSEVDETDVAKIAMISLDWGAFAKSMEALQRMLLWAFHEGFTVERGRVVRGVRCRWSGKRANLWQCSRGCKTGCLSRLRVVVMKSWRRWRKRVR